jgi:hypothetical protein
LSGSRPIHAEYALADSTLTLAGKVVESDPVGFTLYRVDGSIIIRTEISGLYPEDTWSGRSVTYQHVGCSSGTLTVHLESDPYLFQTVQTIVAHEDGRIVGRARITPSGHTALTVPLLPEAGNRCIVRYSVAHTAVPALVEPGSQDERRLGAHFLDWSLSLDRKRAAARA